MGQNRQDRPETDVAPHKNFENEPTPAVRSCLDALDICGSPSTHASGSTPGFQSQYLPNSPSRYVLLAFRPFWISFSLHVLAAELWLRAFPNPPEFAHEAVDSTSTARRAAADEPAG
jgi:hypothetical protein